MKYFEKIAKLNISNIEKNLGLYLADPLEDEVRNYIAQEEAKRFALRHPVLTGIPTLGLAPAFAEAKAIDEISRRIARKHLGIRNELYNRRRQQEAEALEYWKANQAQRATQSLGTAAMGVASILSDRD